jgi:hypothetical protein
VNEYFAQDHTHVLMKDEFITEHVKTRGSVTPVFTIVHHVGNYVWIAASYSDDFPADVCPVGDGRSNAFDSDGNYIASVPVSYVKKYMNETEYDQLIQAIDADEKLLRYAR